MLKGKKAVYLFAALFALTMAGPVIYGLDGAKPTDAQIEQRVKDTLSKMTLEEKLAQTAGKEPAYKYARMLTNMGDETWDNPAIKRLNVPAFNMIDGPRGVGLQKTTAFTVGMSRGASWDKDLEYRIGEAMGYEGRALGANIILEPCINILRHPLWGRAQESYGEDPYLLGVMGVANIQGVQNHIMACAKHYAANNTEDNRMSVDVQMDERTLREIYLPHFKMTVDAGVATVMSAYNLFRGDKCGQNKHLSTEILKDEWGFKGIVMSDWVTATNDGIRAANGGMDIEMPEGTHMGKSLKKPVEEGKVPMSRLDDMVSRILRVKFRYIPDNFTAGYDKKKVAGAEHAALAREAAQKGSVLLKNDNSALPIDKTKVKTIAVFGKLANTKNIGDMGSSDVHPPYVVKPLEGIKNKAGASVNVNYFEGTDLAAAKSADASILFVGYTWRDEGEGNDRKSLDLHKDEIDLINAVCEASKRCIVVIEGGSAILMDAWKDKPEAILMAWYPGMEGGNAIADILFGDVNPSGKLPITFPKSADQLPPFMNKDKEAKMDYYHGYRLFDKKGLESTYPFGYGLSYTTYKYSNLKLDKKSIGKSGKIVASVDVTNTGKMAGEEVVELYVGYKGSKVDRVVKDLKAFAKVGLKPSETKTVPLEVKAENLAYWDKDKNGWVVEEIDYTVLVGPSSAQKDLLSETFKISGS
jgi:beta-glucosidase